ncbi:MAG: hypothetical protein ABJF10_21515 [Chthoniobacter sp.]|uniref:hypothetical protein n=1 Tax=Chthoniobacter sp. TaxID=2510640 RepID=UPI0032A286CD
MCTLVLGSLMGFSGCKKQVAKEEVPEEVPAATPAPKLATPEPKPVAVATPTPPPATPAPELAPPGVFYLVTKVSVETSDGILGLKPGQPLREVRPGVYKADNNEVTLRPDQVTNDMAVARRLVVQDQKTQAAIQQRLAAPGGQVPPAASATPPSSSARPAPVESAAEIARKELLRQREALQQASNRLAISLNEATSRFGGNWQIGAKKSPQAFQLLQQFNGLQKQIGDVDGQLSQLR